MVATGRQLTVPRRLARAMPRRQAVALFGSLAPLLAACAGPAASPGGPAGQQSPGTGRRPVTIRWSPYDGEGQAIVDGAKKGAELFASQHPNLTVQISPEIRDDFGAKIDTMIAAGDGPDLFGGNGAAWRDRAVRGQFLGLDSLIKRDFRPGQIADYVESHYKAFNLPQTGQFSLPMYLGTMALYYNKGWFRERGVPFPDDTWDWNRWTDAMRRLTVPPDRFGAELLTLSRSRAMMLILQNGGHMVDPRNDTICVIDQPAALEALQWINDRAWKDHTAVQNPEAATLGQNVTQRFVSGKVATFIEGSWRLAPMAIEVPAGVEWDVAPLPRGKVKRSTRATTDGWAIWQGSKNPDEAWSLMRWLQGDDWYEIMMSVVGLSPARISQQDKWVSLVAKAYPQLASKNLKTFTDAVRQKYAEPEEFFRYHKDATDIVDPAYNNSVRDNKENVSTTFQEVARRVTDVQRQRAGQ